MFFGVIWLSSWLKYSVAFNTCSSYSCLIQLGKTKVFLRAGQIGVLDSRRAEVLDSAAKLIQGRLRTFLARRDFLSYQTAAISLQACCRGLVLIWLKPKLPIRITCCNCLALQAFAKEAFVSVDDIYMLEWFIFAFEGCFLYEMLLFRINIKLWVAVNVFGAK